MHLPLTHKILENWAGRTTFQKGSALFEKGKVEKVEYEPPFVFGLLATGARGMRSKFELLNDGYVENHCPCRENQEEGKICAHLVALGLEIVRLYSDPRRVEKIAQEKRRAERLASFAPSAYHTCTPDGVPSKLRLILKQSWRKHLSEENRVPMRCVVETGGQLIPLNEFPKNRPMALSRTDKNLLFVLEDICEGPAKGKFTASSADFINILELCAGGPLYEGGVEGTLKVGYNTTAISVDLKLNEKSGELLLTLRAGTEDGGFDCVISGAKGWILHNGVFSRLETVLPGPMRSIYEGAVRIPRSAIPAFIKNELPVFQKLIPVNTELSADMLSLSPACPRFRLAVEGTQQVLCAKLYAEYGTVRLIAGRAETKGDFALPLEDDLLGFQTRNSPAEKKALELVTDLGFYGHRGDMLRQIKGTREVLNFLGGGMPRLLRKGWQVDLDGMIAAFMDQAVSAVPVTRIRSSAGSRFFEIDCSYETQEGQSLDKADIQRAINMGDAFIEKKGHISLLDIEAVKSVHEVFSDCSVSPVGEKPGVFEMNDVYAAYVHASLLALDGIDIETPPEWKGMTEARNRKAGIKPVPLEALLENTLRNYQKKGVYWLRFMESSGFCGILADEMGLGKTLQTLAWLALERVNKEDREIPALIVCPTSLVENWIQETTRFVPRLRIQKMHGANRHAYWKSLAENDLIITSYALIRSDLEAYLVHRFSVIVLDEAQHIKNRATQNAVSVKKIQARHRLVLTGTPIENSVTDLWSIMDFLMPGYLGNYKTFRENYQRPIQNGGTGSESAQIRLRRKLHPFLLRRLKKEVAGDLPDKIQRIAYCALSGDQAEVYKQLAEKAKNEISSLVKSQGFNKSRMQVLKILLQLRQTCCHLDLLKLPNLKSDHPSGKLDMFFELVHEALDASHRMLVFSQFTSMLAIIRKELEKQDLKYRYLDGSTMDRQKRVQQFNSDQSIPIFLISLKAGGSGLNLTGADMVIHFDPWWNPAVEDQATDRAHRIGQKNTVYSIKLISKGTVEEKVLQMQQKKQSIIDAALEKGDNPAHSLTWEDVRELLSV